MLQAGTKGRLPSLGHTGGDAPTARRPVPRRARRPPGRRPGDRDGTRSSPSPIVPPVVACADARTTPRAESDDPTATPRAVGRATHRTSRPPSHRAGRDPAPTVTGPATRPRPSTLDATGRFIVMLRNGTRHRRRRRQGRASATASRPIAAFDQAVRGFSAKLDKKQKHDLLADPNVAGASSPTSVVQLTARPSRPASRASADSGQPCRRHRRHPTTRVDADVAIVDTGHHGGPGPQRRRRLQLLDVGPERRGATRTTTAPTWPARSRPSTTSFGVVGVAPGARVWGVKILNDSGYGLISWYLCGLDWILAQRDPNDAEPAAVRSGEHERDQGRLATTSNCGLTNNDVLHQAICRVVAGGITVVAAAANDSHSATHNIPASYNEVITVSALADTDGIAGRAGREPLLLVGRLRQGRHVRRLQQLRLRRRPHRPGQVHPGRPSRARPTSTCRARRWPRRRSRARSPSTRRAGRTRPRPRSAKRFATSATSTGTSRPTLTRPTSRCSTSPGSDHSGRSASRLRDRARPPRAEHDAVGAVLDRAAVRRSSSASGCRSRSLPPGWTGSPVPSSLMGWTANAGQLSVKIPPLTPPGTYTIGVRGTNQGRTADTDGRGQRDRRRPDRQPAADVVPERPADGSQLRPRSASVARGDRPVLRDRWLPAPAERQRWRMGRDDLGVRDDPLGHHDGHIRHHLPVPRSRGRRGWPLEPVGHRRASRFHAYDDRSSRIVRHGTWAKVSSSKAFKQTLLGGSRATKWLQMTFTGHSIGIVAPKEPLSRQGLRLRRRRPRGDDQPEVVDIDDSPFRLQSLFPGRRDAHDPDRPDRDRRVPAHPGRRVRLRGLIRTPSIAAAVLHLGRIGLSKPRTPCLGPDRTKVP